MKCRYIKFDVLAQVELVFCERYSSSPAGLSSILQSYESLAKHQEKQHYYNLIRKQSQSSDFKGLNSQ
jgi:hypothetical protein